MNQLIEILQKIRLLDDPYETINEFINYMLGLNKVYFSGRIRNGQFAKVKQLSNNLSLENKITEDLLAEIYKYLDENKTTKYVCCPSNLSNVHGDKFQWCIVPFIFGKNKIYAIFIFETQQQNDDFAHQSAIILSVQLNLILNNLTLKELAITDGLTRLRNSSYFREQLEFHCSKHLTGQLILFDVDFFKKVNDIYGHLGGDAVLIMIGEKIPQVVKSFLEEDFSDAIIARVVGEEFAIFIPDRDEKFGCDLAELIRSEIEKTPVSFNKIIINVTISLGVSSWTFNERYSNKKVTALYKTCDEALYRSKKSGRNQVSFLNVA
jgi:diguanylate cyclase (GGDEF)-like protein